MGLTLEVCVDSADGLRDAVAGGADRIELCAALSVGGLTPSAGLVALAARAGVPALAMIRPRAGDFIWSETEVGMMEAEIAAARAAGLTGVVLGASRADGRLDTWVLDRLVAAAMGLDLTLHRCFDLVPDMGEALEQAIALGFHRILTSGGAATAGEGAETIARLVAQASGRISIMPGAGVDPACIATLRTLGVTEFHASCSVPHAGPDRAVALGFWPATLRVTARDKVQALKQALAQG